MLVVLLAALSGCASQPSNIENVCTIFDENGGWFNNWYKQSRKVEKEFGVPVPVLMATIWKESAFNARAKPPRRKLLGFIPWKRPSDAYGYPQALKSTWKWYKDDTGRGGADRNDFGDAVHFVGWYYYQSHKRNGIPRNDAYNLYLSYYAGHGGYASGSWKNNRHMKTAAARVASMEKVYRQQLASCR
jgi:hypothetical protein